MKNNTKYIINKNIIQDGDIILSREKTKISKSIQLATFGNYSHAMIISGQSILHSTRDRGLFSDNYQRMLYGNKSDIIILRHKSNISTKIMTQIITFIRQKIGTDYSIKEAISVPMNKNNDKKTTSKKLFCSRIIAQAYKYVNLPIVANEDYCSPQDIYDSKVLYKVDGEHLIEATQAEINFTNTPNRIEDFRIIMDKWLSKAKEIGKAHNFEIQSINDVDKFIIKYPNYDLEISNYIIDSGYLNYYETEKSYNSYRFDYKQFIERIEYIEYDFLDTEMQKELDLIKRNATNYLISLSNLQGYQLKIFELNRDLALALLKFNLECLEVLKKVFAYKNDIKNSNFIKLLIDVVQAIIECKVDNDNNLLLTIAKKIQVDSLTEIENLQDIENYCKIAHLI